MSPVGGGQEQDIGGRAGYAPLKGGLERLGRLCAVLEGQVVAEHHETFGPRAQQIEEAGQGGHLITVHLHQLEVAAICSHGHEGRLGHRALPGATDAPEQDMVEGEARGEALEVGAQEGLLAIHPHQGVEGQGVVPSGCEPGPGGVVAEQPRQTEVGNLGRARRQALQRLGDADQQGGQVLGHAM